MIVFMKYYCRDKINGNEEDETCMIDNGNKEFLILNFRRVLIVVSFLLGKSPASVY